MVDLQTVCSMCGDVGFPDKLFRCSKCHHRFQHSYCSSNYSEFSEPIQVCDWCQSEQRSSRHGGSSRKSAAAGGDSGTKRSEYSGDKIKQHDHHDGCSERRPPPPAKNPGGAPSPRPTTRRYKLLKDVMC
nr:Zinc finger, FYVE/PHD-type [Ipomoea batatas]